MDKISFLIFDLDDTLIHSNIDYGTMKQRILNFFDDKSSLNANVRIKELLDRLKVYPDKLQKAYKIIEDMESGAAEKVQSIPNADATPDLLRDTKLHAAILTNNSSQSTFKYLKNPKLQYLKDIGPIITRNDVSAMKPDPAGLLHILSRFNLRNTEVFFIGDSYIDAEAAHKAGIKFLLVNYRNLDLENFANTPPYKIFSQLSEVFLFIRKYIIDCVY